jgi:hypothetical protein
MSVCVLIRAGRPGVSLATRESARDVLAIDLRSERNENILMVAEEAGEEAAAMEGLRFIPACSYLRQEHG